jgi:hypothetical protein
MNGAIIDAAPNAAARWRNSVREIESLVVFMLKTF